MDINGRQTPNDMYGAAKTAAHYMLETRARILKMPFNWAVVPSTFGEGRKDNNIITYTINSLLNEEKPRYGYLLQMWDFLYVKEVARALYLIGEKGLPNKTYGIGSGVFKPLKDYIEKIRDIIDPSLPLGIGDIPSLSDKAFSSCVSIYDITKDTGFVPEISFEEGIRRTIPYYRDRIR
jgi:nucleoside-diphosphate-sugar epimerase